MVQKKTLVRNSISGAVQLSVTALLTFICIPIFIGKLGTELYAVFGLVSIIGNLNLLTNIGLDSTLTKFLAEQGRGKESNQDVITALLFSTTLITLISLGVYLCRFFLLREILHIPRQYVLPAERLLSLLLIANGILLVGQTLTSMLHALQRMYLSNLLQLFYSVIYWLGTIVVVSMGYGLPAVGVVMLLAAVLWMVCNIASVSIYWKSVRAEYSWHIFQTHARKQIGYGIRIYTSSLISFFNEPLIRILLSHLFGLNVVAYYDIAIRVKTQLMGLFHKIVIPLYPFISQLTDREFLALLVKDLTKKLLLLSLPVAVLLLFTCYPIVTLWIGQDVWLYTAFIIGIVVPFILCSPPTIPIYYYLMSKGHPQKTIVFQLFTVVCCLLLFFLFYPLMGVYALLLANALECVGSFLLGIHYQSKYQGITYRRPRWLKARKYLLLGLLYAAIGLIGYGITNPYLSIATVAVLMLLSTVYLYKHLHIVEQSDVKRYFSENASIVSFYQKL
ncbi:MAG: oligosaccharide flippase family protein [Prevotellaceae bacterium]|jgi:O-antigen/teichoic acid export membrane protein|nr:oligosaccharide flippase family protein [Prevotellaceae bacterium]